MLNVNDGLAVLYGTLMEDYDGMPMAGQGQEDAAAIVPHEDAIEEPQENAIEPQENVTEPADQEEQHHTPPQLDENLADGTVASDEHVSGGSNRGNLEELDEANETARKRRTGDHRSTLGGGLDTSSPRASPTGDDTLDRVGSVLDGRLSRATDANFTLPEQKRTWTSDMKRNQTWRQIKELTGDGANEILFSDLCPVETTSKHTAAAQFAHVLQFCKGNSLTVAQAEGYGEIVMKLGEAGSPPREITPIAEDDEADRTLVADDVPMEEDVPMDGEPSSRPSHAGQLASGNEEVDESFESESRHSPPVDETMIDVDSQMSGRYTQANHVHDETESEPSTEQARGTSEAAQLPASGPSSADRQSHAGRLASSDGSNVEEPSDSNDPSSEANEEVVSEHNEVADEMNEEVSEDNEEVSSEAGAVPLDDDDEMMDVDVVDDDQVEETSGPSGHAGQLATNEAEPSSGHAGQLVTDSESTSNDDEQESETSSDHQDDDGGEDGASRSSDSVFGDVVDDA